MPSSEQDVEPMVDPPGEFVGAGRSGGHGAVSIDELQVLYGGRFETTRSNRRVLALATP